MTELLKGDIWQEVENTSSTSALRADTPVFVPDSPCAATAETPETQFQQTTQSKETVWNEVPPARPSLSEGRSEEAGKNVNMPEVRVKLLRR